MEARPGGGNWKHFYSASELPLASPLQPIPHTAAGGIFLKQAPDHCTPLFQKSLGSQLKKQRFRDFK